MYTPEKMKLNKHIQVKIPKNSDFFARLNGNMPTIPTAAYSGDEPVPSELRKTEYFDTMDQFDKMKQRMEYVQSQSND